MAAPAASEPDTQLIVFADDWGRHPSSAQHLVKAMLPAFPTLWVNTVGTRTPGLNRADLKRGAARVKQWLGGSDGQEDGLPCGLEVIAPRMYPGFRRGWQRRFNARRVSGAISRSLGTQATPSGGPRGLGGGHPRALRRVVVTTLPITADLVGTLGADRWVYYCVDDYSQWPGTDHAVMDAMERELVAKVDAVVCVSETLQERVASMGRQDSTLMTHGVDVEMWQTPSIESPINTHWPSDEKPIALFWGLIDQRLDHDWIAALCIDSSCRFVLAGPKASDLPRGYTESGIRPVLISPEPIELGPIALRDLPAHAASAQVLVMPYIDAPVTRAMQPLKLKEYLATMKPVVVRDLPATREWAACCDLASSAEQFVQLIEERARTGTPADQLEARKRRLPGESWSAKAAQLAGVIRG